MVFVSFGWIGLLICLVWFVDSWDLIGIVDVLFCVCLLFYVVLVGDECDVDDGDEDDLDGDVDEV